MFSTDTSAEKIIFQSCPIIENEWDFLPVFFFNFFMKS